MSRKPTIKISYPEAREKALQLTEAMVKRAPGKRVVETESEDPIFPDGGELFSSFIRCKTQTGVELTLTLNASSMDYMLETLIKPNLTADEKKQILGEDDAGGSDIFSARAVEAAGASTCTDAVDSASRAADGKQTQSGEQEKMIEVGKISDNKLRDILADLVDAAQGYIQGGPDAWENYIENAIETAIKEIDHCAGVIDLNETYNEERNYSYKTYALFGLILATIELLKPTKRDSPTNTLLHYLTLTKEHLEKNSKDAEGDFLHALHIGWTSAYNQPQMLENARGLVDRITKRLYDEDHPKPDAAEPSWDDAEKEAQTIGRHKADEADDIEPGLLNDLDESDCMAPAEEVMGHDE